MVEQASRLFFARAGETPTPPSMPDRAKKPLMRSLGEFLGHIVKGIRTDPSRKVIRKDVQEERRADGVVLRRTTIEEVELKKKE